MDSFVMDNKRCPHSECYDVEKWCNKIIATTAAAKKISEVSLHGDKRTSHCVISLCGL